MEDAGMMLGSQTRGPCPVTMMPVPTCLGRSGSKYGMGLWVDVESQPFERTHNLKSGLEFCLI
jgi:hypothetical protein